MTERLNGRRLLIAAGTELFSDAVFFTGRFLDNAPITVLVPGRIERLRFFFSAVDTKVLLFTLFCTGRRFCDGEIFELMFFSRFQNRIADEAALTVEAARHFRCLMIEHRKELRFFFQTVAISFTLAFLGTGRFLERDPFAVLVYVYRMAGRQKQGCKNNAKKNRNPYLQKFVHM